MEGLKGRTIMVTGGTGFVGSHLVAALSKRGARIVVPYRSLDPHSYFVSQGLEKKVILAIGDVTDGKRMIDIITMYDIEDIFHLSAQSIVTTAYHNPIQTIETNIMGAANILHASWVSGTVRRIIMTSTDKAYGKSDSTYTEKSPLLPDHPYESSKAAADLVTRAYIKTYGAPVSLVRFGNIYGPGDLHESRIIPAIMHAILSGETLHLRSDGTFIRDYIHVSDIVSAYLFIHAHMPKLSGEEFNIASHTNISVLELIAQTEKQLKVHIPYVLDNTQQNEISRQHLNWEKIKSLGWTPSVSLEQGLKESFVWYKNNHVL